ncbi:cytochrome c oxidase subunit 3 [Arenibaculum sp.]|jgi:cytochrome c oxidase subunit I+III|uniref:cytochrome c oxidase subunit 3 n=1 Tax=Arenibaculum sp. TaxID=2865862 RepID=UPI002E142D0E|nr:cytochrome c oxidase subunit 3 [Arenibaculum sp.]
MDTRSTVDVAGFSRFAANRHPLWWGVLWLIMIELTVVSAFIVSYFYLMRSAEAWPPAGIEPPPLLWPSVNLALLLASMVTMWWASWGLNRDNRAVLIAGLSLSLLFHCTVLALRWREMQLFGFKWSDHAYGSIVWTITGFHFTHIASAIVGTAVVLVLAIRGYFNPERQLAVVVDTLYWYFVSAAWVPFYLTLYWAPRLL